MNTVSWFKPFKFSVPSEEQPWMLAVLRQDASVWQALHTRAMQQKLAERAAQTPQAANTWAAAWSPASLALLTLTSDQELIPAPPLPPALSQQATQTYRTLRSQSSQKPPPAPTLSQAGLAALALSEQYHESASWAETIDLLNTAAASTWQTALACLYGWLPATSELLRLLLHANPARYTALTLHVLLSNPIPPIALVEILDVLFNPRQHPALAATHQLSTLELLEARRPQAAAALSQLWLSASPSPSSSSTGAPLANRLEDLAQSILSGEIQRLAQPGNPGQPALDQMLEGTLGLHADIFARWSSENLILPPAGPSIDQQAALAVTLVNAGRYAEAATALPGIAADTDHPGLLFAFARLTFHTGEITQAQAAAGRLAEIIFASPAQLNPQLTPWLPNKKTAQAFIELFLELQMPSQAAQAAEWALQSYPNEATLLALLAQAQRSGGQNEKACQALQAAVCLEPGSCPLRRQLAASLEELADWETACTERAIILEQEPSLPENYHALANCALHAARPQQARQACQDAIRINPEDGQAYAMLGDALVSLKDRPAAQSAYQQAVQIAPTFAQPWLGLARLQIEDGLTQTAIQTLQTALQAVPDSSEIHFILGECYLSANMPTQACDTLSQVLKLDPHHIQAALLLSTALQQTGHPEQAIHVLSQAYQVDPLHVELAYTYARALLETDQYAGALAPLQMIVDTTPTDPEPYVDLGQVLLEVGFPGSSARAVTVLQHAIQIKPGHPRALGFLAEAFFAEGQHESALSTYRAALDSPLARQASWLARLSFGLGQTALGMGDFQTAIAALEEAAAVQDPQSSVQPIAIRRTLSQAYQAAGLRGAALNAARSALELGADDANLVSWFASQMLELFANQPARFPASGRTTISAADSEADLAFEDAIQALQHVIQLEPGRTALLLQLAKILLRTNQKALAVETLHQLARNSHAAQAQLQDAAALLKQVGDHKSALTCLERACKPVPGQDEALLASILADLADAYQVSGNLNAALRAVEQAITRQPKNARLYHIQARLLIESNRPLKDLLPCLEKGIRASAAAADNVVSPADELVRLLILAAQLYRAAGDFTAACLISDKALELLSPSLLSFISDHHYRILTWQAAALRASLHQALLQPEQAYRLLKERTSGLLDQEAAAGECPGLLDLYAELALQNGDIATASRLHLVPISGAPGIRRLALHARLMSLHAGSDPYLVGQNRFGADGEQSAEQAFDTALQIVKSRPPSKSTSHYDASQMIELLALAEAALALEHWNEALELTRQAAAAYPLEPTAQLCLARSLVLQAEYQRLCSAVEITSHAPGQSSIAQAAQREFEQAIQNTQQLLPSVQPADDENRIACCPNVERWLTRGAVVFNTPPPAQTFDHLTTWLSRLGEDNSLEDQNPAPTTERNEPASMDRTLAASDIAALIAGTARLPSIQENVRWPAVLSQAARRFTSHTSLSTSPYSPVARCMVLFQVALALSSTHPRQALSAARPASQADLAALPPGFAAIQSALVAQLAFQQQNLDLAQKSIEAALQIWPDEPQWQALAARICSLQTDRNAAIHHLQLAIQKEPEVASYRLDLGHLYLSATGTGSLDIQRAVETLQIACQLAPQSPQAWLALAQAHHMAGNTAQTITCLDQAILLAPSLGEALLLRSQLALQNGSPEDALDYAQRAASLHPIDPSAWEAQASALQALGRIDQAVQTLDQALEVCPETDNAHPLLALARTNLVKQMHGPKVALVELDSLANRYPKCFKVHAAQALALAEDEQPLLAIQAAQRALQAAAARAQETGETNPDESIKPSELAGMHYLAGHFLRQTGQLDQAVHHLIQAVQINPSFLDAQIELGFVHKDRREYQAALQAFEQAALIAPHDPRPPYQAALALKEGKDYRKAESLLRRAASLSPADVNIRRQLAAVVALNLIHSPKPSGQAWAE